MSRSSLLGGAFLCAALSAPAVAQEVRAGDLTAHLFLEHSGRLSDDLLGLKQPNLSNLPLGKGVFGEPANALVLRVTLIGAPNTQPKHASAMVTIATTNRAGQRRTETRPLMGLAFGPDGRLTRIIALEGATCSRIEVEVKARGPSKRATLDFACSDQKAAEVQPPRR